MYSGRATDVPGGSREPRGGAPGSRCDGSFTSRPCPFELLSWGWALRFACVPVHQTFTFCFLCWELLASLRLITGSALDPGLGAGISAPGSVLPACLWLSWAESLMERLGDCPSTRCTSSILGRPHLGEVKGMDFSFSLVSWIDWGLCSSPLDWSVDQTRSSLSMGHGQALWAMSSLWALGLNPGSTTNEPCASSSTFLILIYFP